jgi:predicted dehydrogenase
MAKKLNIGIIGAGMIGDNHINSIRQDGRADVTWIATRSAETMKTKLRRHDISQGTTDYREILADKTVDAVIIASPPFTHLDMVKASLKAGKHILLEKPMTVNRHELQQLEKLVNRYPDQIVLECSCRHARLQPKFVKVKEMIDSDAIGDVYHIHHNHLMRSTFIEYNPHGTWALEKTKSGGGPIMDWGVYDLSFHLGLLNDKPCLNKIHSFTRGGLKMFKDPHIKQNVEEHGAAYMEFDNGLTYYYERGAGVHCEVTNETRIYGTKGSLLFSFCSWDPPEIEHFYIDKNGNERLVARKVNISRHPDDNLLLIRHFFDCILKGAKPMMPVSLAAKHLHILFDILES